MAEKTENCASGSTNTEPTVEKSFFAVSKCSGVAYLPPQTALVAAQTFALMFGMTRTTGISAGNAAS